MDAPTALAARTLTKIIATVGPASAEPEIIARLIQAGVSIFRLNFSHGTPDDLAARLATIRRVARDIGEPTAVLGDLQGPKIRVGKIAGAGIEFETGASVVIEREEIVGTPPVGGAPCRVSSTCPGLVDDAQPGQRVLINDGAVRMLVVERTAAALVCTVTHGGLVTSGKGINLPETDLRVETITARDWRWVEWSIDHGLDFLALSFVRSADDVRELAAGIGRLAEARGLAGLRLPIVAKIEVPKALDGIDAIAEAADGIMIARGDLGVEMDLARVPVIQKRLIAAAKDHGKPCIVATQMLESMIEDPAPTRAEANDVAAAIFDEVDAVMLSGETAVGKYPVVTVDQMRRIVQHAEAHVATLPARPSPPARLVQARSRIAALAHGVWTIAQDIAARCIVVWSQRGGGARYLSQNRFRVPIVAVTSDERAARQMQLLRGVAPVVRPVPDGLGALTALMDAHLQKAGYARADEPVILVAGEPLGEAGVTNSLAIHIVGDPESGYAGH